MYTCTRRMVGGEEGGCGGNEEERECDEIGRRWEVKGGRERACEMEKI